MQELLIAQVPLPGATLLLQGFFPLDPAHTHFLSSTSPKVKMMPDWLHTKIREKLEKQVIKQAAELMPPSAKGATAEERMTWYIRKWWPSFRDKLRKVEAGSKKDTTVDMAILRKYFCEFCQAHPNSIYKQAIAELQQSGKGTFTAAFRNQAATIGHDWNVVSNNKGSWITNATLVVDHVEDAEEAKDGATSDFEELDV